jgi:hypothetical protein
MPNLTEKQIREYENDPANWQEASAQNGLKYFYNSKVRHCSIYFKDFCHIHWLKLPEFFLKDIS